MISQRDNILFSMTVIWIYKTKTQNIIIRACFSLFFVSFTFAFNNLTFRERIVANIYSGYLESWNFESVPAGHASRIPLKLWEFWRILIILHDSAQMKYIYISVVLRWCWPCHDMEGFGKWEGIPVRIWNNLEFPTRLWRKESGWFGNTASKRIGIQNSANIAPGKAVETFFFT